MKYTFLFVLLFAATTAFAQQTTTRDQASVSATGTAKLDQTLIVWTSGSPTAADLTTTDGKISMIAGAVPSISVHGVIADNAASVSTPLIQTITVAPNPACNYVELDLTECAAPTNINIYNTLGVLVQQTPVKQAGKVGLDIRSLTPGFYLVRITDRNGNVLGHAKLQIQR